MQVDRSVSVLVVFHNGNHKARERNAGTIDSVNKGGLAVFVSVADAGAARLVVLEVGAGGDFQPLILRGRPQFDVVALGGAEAEVTST